MARRATLKDVAAAAGVSVTTVSLVLNDRPARVSTEKREAIAQAVKQLNYVPKSEREEPRHQTIQARGAHRARHRKPVLRGARQMRGG